MRESEVLEMMGRMSWDVEREELESSMVWPARLARLT
jgi:hypothetical protein